MLKIPELLKYELVPPVTRTLLAKVAVAALLNKPLLLKYDVTPPVKNELLFTRKVAFTSREYAGVLQLIAILLTKSCGVLILVVVNDPVAT